MPSSLPSGSFFDIGIRTGFKVIGDYSFSYDQVETAFKGKARLIFPPTGHLIFNFFFGDNFNCQLLKANLSAGQTSYFYITGLLSRGALTTAQQGHGGGYVMKVHPVMGYHFLRMPMCELTDRQVRLSHAFDKNILQLRQLVASTSMDELDHPCLKQLFSKYLPDKSRYLHDPIYHAVNKIIARKGIIQVRALAKEFCMSERTLHRQFLQKVGLSPQAYAKIWQLCHVMELLKSKARSNLSDIAFEAGYYDVAHLARDFRNKLFVAPSKFFRGLNTSKLPYLDFPESLK